LNVIITGTKGYLAGQLKTYLLSQNFVKNVYNVSLRDDNLSNIDFNGIDIVIHTAGLVHQSEKHFKLQDYLKINSQLTYDLAIKAKEKGVKKFIFISTLNIYGIQSGIINSNIKPNPKSYYGISKFEAENLIVKLQDSKFDILILRVPMIYGKNSPGNFTILKKFSLYFPVFGCSNTKRSIIHVNNLASFITVSILLNAHGIYLVKDKNNLSSTEIFITFRRKLKKKYFITTLFNFLVWLLSRKIYARLFSSLVIDDKFLESQYNYSKLTRNFQIDERKMIESCI
jgi:UDP-glucose 4-epimerase